MAKSEEGNERLGSRAKSNGIATYNEAVDRFSRSVTAFMEQIHHLTEARQAYEQAMEMSAEFRRVLDMGDEKLRSLMRNLEHAIDAQFQKRTLEKKEAEPVKLESIPPDNEEDIINLLLRKSS